MPTDGWVAAPEVLQLPACRMSAGSGDLQSHQSSIFQCVGGVGAEVFGDAGEAEAGLFDSCRRQIIERS
ncbi:hypothetical protein [Nostoc sp. LEGE 12450]|uniref:hypothetical protein n=1 Tax=Nostoc sp. LEGE 12450 TaxID=1828643 RepID=UPI00188171C4|nr:hypothetical protein [Nostoc sp. LEGE 12450]MBE8989939.1 hypothetical protein [Nostoc sp. LEGE 12450]